MTLHIVHVHGGQVSKRQRVQNGPSQMAERLKAYQRKQTRIVKVLIIAERDSKSKCSWKKQKRITKVSPPTYSHIVLPGCTHKIQKCVLISSYLCVSSHWLLVNMFVHILQAGPKYGRFKNMIWGCKLFEIFSSSCFMSHALAWPGDRTVHCRPLHCPGDSRTSCNLLTQYS